MHSMHTSIDFQNGFQKVFAKSETNLKLISNALLLKRHMTSSVSSDGNTSCGNTV